MARKRNTTINGATLGFEQTLWAAADQLRGHMDAATGVNSAGSKSI